MKLANHAAVPVYVLAGASTARALPEWLARKRKRSLKNDPEYTSRVELLQDFEFEEASQCIRVSEDGNWVMSTGTYKPQIHTHNLPNLALSFARHTVSLNTTFEILSTDYSKSVHLQADRALEFHTPEGCRYTTRIPRYGRDLKYSKRSTETLVPAAGVNEAGNGEVFRLHLEHGRFMRPYEIDVGGDDLLSTGAGSLQGGVRAGSVNTAAIAEDSHNLLAFGTSLGTVEFFDPRARDRIGTVQLSADALMYGRQETTALEFDHTGLNMACGTSGGLLQIYDLRSPTPIFEKDQGYGCPIKSLLFLTPSANLQVQSDGPKLLSADKRIIKIWDTRSNGAPWTSVEPAVDLNSVAWCKDSGMLLTANEGRQQHAFFIPQLGPAPKWCSFLDNLVEEMAEDADDPNAFTPSAGEVYENYKFLTPAQLEALNLAHLIGTTNLLRPYMHGFFVAQKLYEEARIIADPFVFEDQRAKRLKEKLDKERESRIRGSQRLPGKVNKALAEKIISKTTQDEPENETAAEGTMPASGPGLLSDPRFAKLFTDESYAIDEGSKAFKDLNPNSQSHEHEGKAPRKLTAVEEEELHERSASSSSSSNSESEPEATEKPQSERKPRKQARPEPARPVQARVAVSSSNLSQGGRDRTFGSRAAAKRSDHARPQRSRVVGEQETSFIPSKRSKRPVEKAPSQPRKRDNRRSASGNVMRSL